CRCGVDRAECHLVRREMTRGAHRVPLRRDGVELHAHQRTKQPPEAGAAQDGVRCQTRELLPDHAGVHDGSWWMRRSCPSAMPNMAAALPPLIAIEMFL